MKHSIHTLLVAAALLLLGGCMKWDYGQTEEVTATGAGLFVLNEGNFQYGNASLTYYDPETKQAENELFRRANGFRLGDVAQSMTVRDGIGWIVVNNSHVIFAIDLVTCREVGRITDLTSPRYIHFLSDEKAYVTQLWDNRIFIVDPKRFEITGCIECPRMTMESGSTEQMVQYGRYLFVTCWSYQNRILKIDTETDTVVDELTVGIPPRSCWTATASSGPSPTAATKARPTAARPPPSGASIPSASPSSRSSASASATPPPNCSSTAPKTASTGSTTTSGRWR